MSRRLLDIVAPVRPTRGDGGYRRVLRWAALPVTNRRWAAPLCALALGFGLFAGVAIGPGATGTLATGTPTVIEMPGLIADGEGGGEAEEGSEAEAGSFAESGGGGESSFPTESSSGSISGFPEAETPESSETSEPAPPAKEPTPTGEGEEPAAEVEEAQVLAGVVVHANPAAGSYAVAEAGGLLSSVHAAKLPAPGAKVSVPVRTLANGTFAEAGPRKQKGKTTQARLAGIVTFVDADPASPAYTVSKRGVSVLVRIHPDPAGAPAVLPQLGAYASVAATIETPTPTSVPPPVAAVPAPVAPAPTCAPDPALPAPPAPVAVLWQAELDADGAPFASSDFEGVVMAVCAAEGTLLLSADDLRASGKDILFTVPKSIDIARLKPGDSVAATAAIEAGGALSLTGLASDERSKGADDAATAQGDLVSHQPR